MKSKAQGPGNLLLYNNLLCAYSGNQRIMESNHENSGQVRLGGGEYDRRTRGKVMIPGEVTWRLQISLFCCHGLILHISITISERLPNINSLFTAWGSSVVFFFFFFSPLAVALFWTLLFSFAMPPFSSSSTIFLQSECLCLNLFPLFLPLLFFSFLHT